MSAGELADVGHLKVRTFLNRTKLVPLQAPFWDLIYDGHTIISLRTAREVALELETAEKTVADVVDGWRPDALTT